MKKVVALTIVFLFAATLVLSWQLWQTFINSPASADTDKIIYEVRPGHTLTFVARDLERNGVVSNANLFLLLARLRGQANLLKVGEYQLAKNMRPSEILTVLTSGQSVGRKFTVTEGLNIYEISELYQLGGFGSRDDFLRLAVNREFAKQLVGEDVGTLEGYLFPETYQITKYTDTRSVLRAMVARFMDVFRRDVQGISPPIAMNRHQIVTLASIIEKETGAPEERPLISSVFHNRLAKNMMLQTDPTILYGKTRKAGRLATNISRIDLVTPDPYNTYTIRGLPPGPIANPGREALLAAVQPEQSNYLFFVSQNDGTHVFSTDLAAHNRAVQTHQKDPRARAGKSWRDLQKRNLNK